MLRTKTAGEWKVGSGATFTMGFSREYLRVAATQPQPVFIG